MRSLPLYLALARPDHWFKNIFVLPGVIFGVLLTDDLPSGWPLTLAIGLAGTCFICSANYVINEWLDRHFDKYHPTKKFRPAVAADLDPRLVYGEYIILAGMGLFLAYSISSQFLCLSFLLLLMGVVYNVPPLRTKEKAYLDVLSESLNNPLRFLLGWSVIELNYLPPSSILLAYWMGGAFLMAVKRFAEFRFIGNPALAGSYRGSFKEYTENSLLISSFFYALCSAFFLGVFLIKYRIEYLLILPLIALLFAWYLQIGLTAGSSAQNPEKLYREKPFVGYLAALCSVFIVLSFVDLPWLHFLLDKALISWKL